MKQPTILQQYQEKMEEMQRQHQLIQSALAMLIHTVTEDAELTFKEKDLECIEDCSLLIRPQGEDGYSIKVISKEEAEALQATSH